MRRLLFVAPLLLLAALAVLFFTFGLRRPSEVRPDAMVGKPVPAITLARLDGGAPVSLAAASRGAVLVNVFASWCAPCIIEHPLLVQLQARGVRIVGIAYKDKAENIRQFVQQRENPFSTIVMDPEGRAGVELGVSGVPETFLVKDGVIVAKIAGPLTPRDADEFARQIGVR